MATKAGVQSGLSDTKELNTKNSKRHTPTEKSQVPQFDKKTVGSGKQKITIM